MFNFMDMVGNHAERLVANTKEGDAVIDTAAVSDSEQPYETGIAHPRYNNGAWVIVEMYDSRTEAKEGHNKWVDIFSQGKLPSELKDVSTSGIAVLLKAFTGEDRTITNFSVVANQENSMSPLIIGRKHEL